MQQSHGEYVKTPNGTTITATAPDGTTVDVTESVAVLYDLVIQSLDWGSGFLTIEDVKPIVALAEFAGFKDSGEARKYIEDQLLAERRRVCDHAMVDVPSEIRAPGAGIHANKATFAYWQECSKCGQQSFLGYKVAAPDS